jgi:zinc transporter 9
MLALPQKAPVAPRGFLPVLAALMGNFFLTIIKFFGFAISGSSAMFSEAVHSLADTMNQALLMIGIRRSLRVADEDFTYGYGHERFIWALMSACGVFFVGAGVTIYRGVETIIHPETILLSRWVFIILGISFVVELATFLIAFRELVDKGDGADLATVLREGDPTTIAILYEDGVAVVGVFIASIGITLSYYTHNVFWDALGSILIGVLLAVVAVILINKNREFLMEKAIPEELKEEIIALLEAEPAIEKVLDFKSSIINIGEYRIKCEIEFNGPALFKEIREAGDIREEYEAIKDDYEEFVRFCVDYVDRIPRLMGNKIDEIEKKLQKEVPEIKHIDIEIN